MVGISAISQAMDIANKLKYLEKKTDEAEFKNQIADLYTALADVKMALADARQQLLEKDDEIANLKKADDSKMRTVSHRGYNFGIDENGNSVGRPFCPVCEQTKGIQIQITRGTSRHDLCPSCNGIYSDHPHKLPENLLPKT